MSLAAKAPYKREMMNIIHYLSYQLEKLGVEVILGEEVTVSLIQRASPDAIVIATGVTPFVPEIKGANPDERASAWEVLSGKKVAENKVLVMGGSSVALETAEVLADDGKEVVVFTENEEVGLDMESRSRFLLLQRLENKRVKILKEARFKECRKNKTILFIDREGREETLEIEFIVSPVQPLSDQKLANELKAIGMDKEVDIYLIGDCLEPRSLYAAIHDGYRVGKEI